MQWRIKRGGVERGGNPRIGVRICFSKSPFYRTKRVQFIMCICDKARLGGYIAFPFSKFLDAPLIAWSLNLWYILQLYQRTRLRGRDEHPPSVYGSTSLTFTLHETCSTEKRTNSWNNVYANQQLNQLRWQTSLYIYYEFVHKVHTKN